MQTTNLTQQLQAAGYYATGGHFRFVSGKHSDSYVQARLSLMDPGLREAFVALAAVQLADTRLSAVAGFTVGGLLLAHALAERHGVPLIVGRKLAVGVEWFAPEVAGCGESVLVVDDALTTTSQIDPALRALEGVSAVERVTAVLIAVRTGGGPAPEVSFRGETMTVRECLHVPLNVADPSGCQLCRYGVPLKDLSNPDRDFISVVLSQPSERAKWILDGYEAVYAMQNDQTLIAEIRAWRPWMPVLLAGLPIARMEEDSRLVRFVTHITEAARSVGVPARVLSDIVGQLVTMSSIRIETRPIGCSLLVGDVADMRRVLESSARVKLPVSVSSGRLSQLVPCFDAFPETRFVALMDPDGLVLDFRRLIATRPRYAEGVELVRLVTARTKAIGFVLRRGRSAVSVYSAGRLEAVGELSQRSGLWEFARPMEGIEQVTQKIHGIGDLLIRIVEVGRELVARGHGGLFIIGDAAGLRTTAPKVHLEPQSIEDLSVDEVAELAKLDGAVMLAKDGQIRQATVIIQNQLRDDATHSSQSLSGHGGSRRETARRTSLECPGCAAVYVSQNGAIEVYVEGHSLPIAEAISGVGSKSGT